MWSTFKPAANHEEKASSHSPNETNYIPQQESLSTLQVSSGLAAL